MKTKKLFEKLENGFDFVFNDTVLTVGEFVFVLFTVIASLYYAITNSLPIIPQWAWAGVFGFMVIVGVGTTENLVYLGVEEDDDSDSELDDGEDEDEW